MNCWGVEIERLWYGQDVWLKTWNSIGKIIKIKDKYAGQVVHDEGAVGGFYSHMSKIGYTVWSLIL